VSGLPLLVLLLIFAAATAAIWVAGVQLSNQTDVLSMRLHLGAALGGLILLAIATNLPSAASRSRPSCSPPSIRSASAAIAP
jgi:cation:H+ antiporter